MQHPHRPFRSPLLIAALLCGLATACASADLLDTDDARGPDLDRPSPRGAGQPDTSDAGGANGPATPPDVTRGATASPTGDAPDPSGSSNGTTSSEPSGDGPAAGSDAPPPLPPGSTSPPGTDHNSAPPDPSSPAASLPPPPDSASPDPTSDAPPPTSDPDPPSSDEPPGPGCCGGLDPCVDVCTPTLLAIDPVCSGCSTPGNEGDCIASTTHACDPGSLCMAIPCGGQTWWCTEQDGLWQWRPAPACDDKDPCTHSDRCDGGVCTGQPVVCEDDACNERVCNGTATCTTVARAGASCDDGDACTVQNTCTAAGTCGGGTPAATCGDGVCNCGETFETCPADCPVTVPANACQNGSQNRRGCGNARTISRAAAASGWDSGRQDTCSGATNNFEGDCGSIWDMGFDHAYALHMRAGERADVTVLQDTRRCQSGDDFRSRLKFRFNPDPSAAGASACPSAEGCFPVSPTLREQSRAFTAPSDGWLFVIVDGGSTGLREHRGYYTLQAQLSGCDSPACGC